MRSTFHDELTDLNREVLRMGQATRNIIENAIKAIVDLDVELADEVIAFDDEIDAMNHKIEDRCMLLIARQAPVAKDLRLCWTTTLIALHLERMADLAVNLAKSAKRINPIGQPISQVSEHINDMGQETLKLVDLCLRAYRDSDIELASQLSDLDDNVDAMHKKIFKQLSQYQSDEPVEWIGNILLASRFLERIADHCVDIAERIPHMATSDFVDNQV